MPYLNAALNKARNGKEVMFFLGEDKPSLEVRQRVFSVPLGFFNPMRKVAL